MGNVDAVVGGVGWDPQELVTCSACEGSRHRRKQPDRCCDECSGTGQQLQGEPPGSAYSHIIDLTGGRL